ncbi:unnamed protein product [Bursaphelenchus okinawaensis]|uniref:Uncharacterized protein n=1 Tax=Bursaphelenchus okinawaensis TaxID=465554 RepID=A0A811LPU3_9BILA|nr:unnamed protein product [Bursaphelenchus okinawaensis]CAG9126666.1 unnamed protein product [Bursaphelenchus okinawaensis]
MDSRLGAVFAAINVSSTTGPQAVCPSSFAQSSAANQIGTVQAGISQIGLSAPFPQTQFNSGAISPPELPFFTQPFQNGLLDPSQFNLANLPTETLQNLNKLVSQPVENLRSSPILTYLRGAVVQALSQSSSGSETSTPDEPPSLEMPSILPSTSEPALPEPNPEVPRRIRRRRPKSPKRSKSPKQKTAEEEEVSLF